MLIRMFGAPRHPTIIRENTSVNAHAGDARLDYGRHGCYPLSDLIHLGRALTDSAQASRSRLAGTRWVLHANQISERGDSIDILELSAALRMLGVDEIFVAFLLGHRANSLERIREIELTGVSLLPYSRDSFRRVLRGVQPTHFMSFSSGAVSGNVFSEEFPHRYRFGDYVYLTHATFRNLQPHGDAYTYVSDWLFTWATQRLREMSAARKLRHQFRYPTVRFDTPIASLPHAVTVQEGDATLFRLGLGIPDSAAVIGRIGGKTQFDDPVAHRAVEQLLNSSRDIWFVGANTNQFLSHDRAIFLPAISRKQVHDFYAGIDVLLNGRLMGESFGRNLVEALKHDVPVIAPHLSRNLAMDAHHVQLLSGRPEWLYESSKDIVTQFLKLRDLRFEAGARALVSDMFTREQLGSGLEKLVPA
jgi:hypothetical protein